MINLYHILRLPPQANTAEIQAALHDGEVEGKIDEKTAKAVREWLLQPEVRARYDARLQMEEPEFFQAALNRAAAQNHTTQTVSKTTKLKIKQPEKATPFAPVQRATVQNDVDENMIEYVPELWNPKAAAIWAFFFNPILGAWLHAHNWRELGFEDKAKKSMTFVWVVVAFYLIVSCIGIVVGFRLPMYTSTVLWVGWFFTFGREQIEFVRDEVGEDYDRLGWFKPIGLAVVAFVGYFMVIFMLIMLAQIAGVLHPSLLAE